MWILKKVGPVILRQKYSLTLHFLLLCKPSPLQGTSLPVTSCLRANCFVSKKFSHSEQKVSDNLVSILAAPNISEFSESPQFRVSSNQDLPTFITFLIPVFFFHLNFYSVSRKFFKCHNSKFNEVFSYLGLDQVPFSFSKN